MLPALCVFEAMLARLSDNAMSVALTFSIICWFDTADDWRLCRLTQRSQRKTVYETVRPWRILHLPRHCRFFRLCLCSLPVWRSRGNFIDRISEFSERSRKSCGP